ncbi:MAG TPA: hypothetical protein VMG59_08130 [Phycisphaerae bacterium]|nr:hypothetical protein [Phycisphaerae bacterium]
MMSLDRLVKRARRLIILVGIIGGLVLIVGVIFMVLSAQAGKTASISIYQAILPGLLVSCIGMFFVCVSLVVFGIASAVLQALVSENWQYEQLRGSMEAQRQLLEAIRESTSLSDSAKEITYRHKDREALRHAIREDIDKNDYEAAYWLVGEMERRFGNRQEAIQLREVIESARRKFIEREVREALDHFDQLMQKFDWSNCQREIEQLTHMFSGHPDIQRLTERMQAAKEAHKNNLLKEWKDAVSRDDVDRSVELLRQLDQYLSPGEAEGYKEVARDVFKKKLQQLGVQFSLHVSDKNWNEALRIGEQIVKEFPNTRIAAEVRDSLPHIKEKAAPAVNIA